MLIKENCVEWFIWVLNCFSYKISLINLFLILVKDFWTSTTKNQFNKAPRTKTLLIIKKLWKNKWNDDNLPSNIRKALIILKLWYLKILKNQNIISICLNFKNHLLDVNGS
jgi:hypothetical protein